jgi:signal transduction histidine kinase
VIHVPTRSLQALRAAGALGRPALWLDGGLALVVLAIAVVHTPAGVLSLTFNVCLVVPLLWRRRAPAIVFSVVWAVAAAQGLTGKPTFGDAALLIAFYTIASGADRRTTVLAGAALELGVILAVSKTVPGAEAWLKAFVGLSGLATAAGVLGINVRNRRQILAGLHERADRLEREHEREMALARATERGLIARDMHDVIAHNVSVMVALCDGAGYHVHDAPERVQAALEQASRSGRQALAEMRQLLGVLRDAPEGPELAPQPGIRQIEELVEQVRRAGIPVSYTLTGKPSGVPPGMELAIYRIVQEGLTNTLKHAGIGARAQVSLNCHEETIEVEISDTGNAQQGNGSGGAGLRGMTERAAVYGGTLQAGPRPDGGWHVSASLTIPAAPALAAS